MARPPSYSDMPTTRTPPNDTAIPAASRRGNPGSTRSGITATPATSHQTPPPAPHQPGTTTSGSAPPTTPPPQAQQTVPVNAKLIPQAIMFTSTPPSPGVVGGSYTVTASGGGSGNPVTFSIDPRSGSACSISGSAVTFTGPGSCVIDANQAGNANYQAAPAAQQTVTVITPL